MPTPKARRSEQLSFRAEPLLVKRIDELRAAMKKRLRGVDLSRSDLLKTLVEQSLPVMEMEYGPERVPDGPSDEDLSATFSDSAGALLNLLYSRGLDINVAGWKVTKKK